MGIDIPFITTVWMYSLGEFLRAAAAKRAAHASRQRAGAPIGATRINRAGRCPASAPKPEPSPSPSRHLAHGRDSKSAQFQREACAAQSTCEPERSQTLIGCIARMKASALPGEIGASALANAAPRIARCTTYMSLVPLMTR